ncbi:MAG: LysM peptidoglycan-binding domain-containing protein, partial [Chloroflexota bacterium]|nr:LysM peptidoglycan-binding domain-containing protein [Chloroflexota bacterium]
MSKHAAVLLLIAISAALLGMPHGTPTASAAPRAQFTLAATRTPTDEPPKPPYVFPTPIFIPTYPGDTPSAPPRGTVQVTGDQTYTVQSGDSPWTIALKVYGDGTKYPLIMSANALTDSTKLRVGLVLKIPPLAGANPQPPALTETPSASTPTGNAAKPTVAPLGTPTSAATASRTPASAGVLPSSIADAAALVVNILTGLFIVAAFIAALLAFLVYHRTRRMEAL